MACTAQSAVDFITSNRSRLIGKLKNLSVILENLNQEDLQKRKVLSDEEVSKIQAECDDYDKTRTILDSVTRKGEEASYKFLRILYKTRKRTLETDLHPWISCFPFKEDTQTDINYTQGSNPCHRYQAKLKSKAQNIANKFWMANKNLFEGNNKPDLSYSSLVLDTQESVSPSKIKKFKSKKSKMSRPKKLRTYFPEDKAGTSPSDLLKRNENILLVGKPGIGKTAVTREMLRLWAQRNDKELDYMFYFDMRETSHITKATSLEELLFNEFSEPDQEKEEVLRDIKENSDSVTLIFDGITDLSSSVVKRLVEKDLLPDAKIIVTCRPGDEEVFPSEVFLRVEVKGFSEQTIKTYFSTILGKEQQKVLWNLELLTLCHVPMYALMVAACFSSETPEDSPQPCTVTEIYINIVRHCLQMYSNNTKHKDLNTFIHNKSQEILSLAEAAFHATEGKSVNLIERPCEDSCVLSFLKPLVVTVALTEKITTYAFLHYTMQEFFAALWLLKNPDQIKDVFQQCLTEEKKHMRHLIPFMCRLLSEKSPSLMKWLIPAGELKSTSEWFLEEVITTFSLCNVDILFLCQCLYESQCPAACIYLLDKLDYHLDLSEESLDSYPCCAVAYVVTQSKERKVWLNLEDVVVSEQGLRQLSGCLQHVQWCGSLPRQLWEITLLSETTMDHISLLGLDGSQMHLPVEGKRLFERAVKFMQKITKVNVCLHWDRETPACQSLCESLLEALPNVSSLSFRKTYRGPGLQDQERCHGTLEREEKQLLLDLCLKAALHTEESFHNVVNTLLSLFSVNNDLHILLDFYQHVKSKGFAGVIQKLRQLFQSAPAVWTINLSERKTSILLEVLKLQSEKKQVKLTGCSDGESEVRSLLQCLPYISQLSFVTQSSEPSEEIKFFGNLLFAAAEREQQTGEKILELLSSVCTYKTFPLKQKWGDFLLDLYSHLKDCETETGLSVLPSLQSVLQSVPAVWTINLSKRKTSILLEVLKLQSGKKQVELTGCSDEESEVRSLLQCLPYISQLSFHPQRSHRSEEIKFFGNLLCAAAEREQQTGEKIMELLSLVCTYNTFPLREQYMNYYNDAERQCYFLLDLYSHLKDCETETGLSVLPSLQSVLQSVPAVWTINLSERKTSILLEVLKLQSEKKQVELTGCSDGESEVRSLLQCLPYISQLSFYPLRFDRSEQIKFFGNLLFAAAEREQQTGEKIMELLSSVCTYNTFPFHEQYMNYYNDAERQCYFLLDLYSHLKDCETETGLSVLPSLQSVLQSAPAVWTINLSERKTSILLEVLKLQSEKKQVELTGCSDEESEVRSLLQCLPYISQLSFVPQSSGPSEEIKFFVNLLCAAAEREQQTGEKILELLSSVCTYNTFPLKQKWGDFLLDLYSHLKDCETETGLSVLPSSQSLLQSARAVWTINLSKRKTSILLEVLKLQSEKKQVKLRGCSDGESEVRSLLQCLPYISQLSFHPQRSDRSEKIKFFGNLLCAAAEREQQTGEKILELLSSVCTYKTFPFHQQYMDDYYDDEHQCDFLLDLYSHLKDCETETGLSVLPSLQSVLQSAPAVWTINLSERKTSILLEVLKLQSRKKQVKLRGCSDEESEMRSLLQCLPYISQLSFYPLRFDRSEEIKFFGNLLFAAAKREQQTGEKIMELLSSVCTYKTFPLKQKWGDFLLDLYSHLKDCETETGLSVLPSLQSVLQSAPAVWTINLSERKTSILLEVLKLQSRKKQVKLRGCSDGESEVRSLLQCLPYISQLSFVPQSSEPSEEIKFFGNLYCAAAKREQQTGEKILELLSSVCTYNTFPLHEQYMNYYNDDERQCDFLLDLCSHLKDCETETGLSVLPSLQSVLQSVPAVWTINLSKRKTSILLEVLKLQSEKKQVMLTGCSHGESEVRSLLQCLPYISQLSFYPQRSHRSEKIKFFGNLYCAAAKREQQTGEKILELLSSVCTYNTFPFHQQYMDDFDDAEHQCDFLLDLYSHLKDCETETGLSVLPSLQSVLQSAPAVWTINLSERKTSILLEVLKLQSEKKQVELTGCSDEESEVRSLLQCLPYISQLSCDPDFFQRVCSSISVRSREEAEQLSSLLQLLGSTLQLTGELKRKTCRSVGRALTLCGSDVDLILTPRKISVRGAHLLFGQTAQLHSLKLSNDMALILCRWVRRGRVACPVTIEELSLSPQRAQPSERGLLKVVSSLASLLRGCTVRRLDLTDFCASAQHLIPLLLHDGPLSIKLSEKIFQQLLSLLREIQDEDFTWSSLSKVDGDLTSCCVSWDLLHYLLQHSAQTITVNLRKSRFLQENITQLLPFVHRIVFKRPSPSFVLAAIREIFKARGTPIIPSFLKSLDHVITLTCTEMDSEDCAALLFTLKHSERVKLSLLWTSIPAGEVESILFTLDKVSELSVDRSLLLRLVHCCAASDAQQRAAVSLLRALRVRLDLSCSSCVELDHSETLSLTGEDCRAISSLLRHSRDTQLILQDCELQDSGLDLLFPVLDRVRLRASKALLLQLVSLLPVNTERGTVRRAVSLCRALGGELDLSHTALDQRACGALALMLEFSEELTELDLSHCQLSDQLLLTLSTHLHKVQVLDLSHNKITDASTDRLRQLVSINPSIDTVRLFGNRIVHKTSFKKDKRFEIW